MTDLPCQWNRIDTILLDMDGVVTSEEAYWDAAGLTIRETLESPGYLGLSPSLYTPVVDLFYQRVSRASRLEWRKFLPEALISSCKTNGINNNWDLAYLCLGLYMTPLFSPLFYYFSLIAEGKTPNLNPDDESNAARDLNRIDEDLLKDSLSPIWDRLIETCKSGAHSDMLRAQDLHLWGRYFRSLGRTIVPINKPERIVQDELAPHARGLDLILALNRLITGNDDGAMKWFDRSSTLWRDCRELFQGWYLGEELYEELNHAPLPYRPKPGLIHQEEPLLGRVKTHQCFSRLKDAGFKLGIATGRPRREIIAPLKRWDMLSYFGETRIATHDEAEKAEAELKTMGFESSLSKPHPFIFLKARYPNKSSLQLVELAKEPPEELQNTLVVGDAQADIWAAQSIQAPCAAVKTGIAGRAQPQLLADSKPDFICDDLTELTEALLALKSPKA